MKQRRNKIISGVVLSIIIVIGLFLRFWKLGNIPSGIYVDEAAIGYNAYSLLKTGLDEYGKSWPVFLRLFGAFSSPLYTFLTVIPVSILGLSVFSARFLSAFSGTLAIIVIYLILNKFRFENKRIIVLVTTFLYAISPWSVFLSRMGTEGHLGFLFTILAVWSLLNALNKKSWTIVASVFLAAATYTYQPLRLVSFLIVAAFMLLQYSRDRRIKSLLSREYILAAAILLLSQIPQLTLLSSPAFTFRAAGLAYKASLWGWAREYFSQLVAYFSPKNLFILGDEDLQRSIPTLGAFYMWEVVLYGVGLVTLVRKSEDIKVKLVWMLMLIFAAVPALTRDPFSTVRSQGLLIPFVIIFAYGLETISANFGQIKTIIVVGLLSLFSMALLWRGYFVLLPFERSRIWNYGFDQLYSQLSIYKDQTIVIDQSRTIPIYEEILFWGKYDPKTYQESQKPDLVSSYYSDLNFDLNRTIGNFEIRPIYWKGDICRKLVLVGDDLAVSNDQAKEHNLTKLFEIYDPNRELLFRAWQTHPEKSCNTKSL